MFDLGDYCVISKQNLDNRGDGDIGPVAFAVSHDPVDQCEKGIIPSDTDIFRRAPFRAALSYDNASSRDELSTCCLDPEALCMGISSVTR